MLCGLALAISVLWYKWILAALTLHPVQILGIFLCMVFLIDLLTYPYQRSFQKKISFEDFYNFIWTGLSRSSGSWSIDQLGLRNLKWLSILSIVWFFFSFWKNLLHQISKKHFIFLTCTPMLTNYFQTLRRLKKHFE